MTKRDIESYLLEGDKLRKKEKWNEAIKIYKKALLKDNDNFNIYERLGLACLKICDYEQAVSYLSRAIQLNPKRYLLYDRRGTAYSFLGNKEKVLENFKQALSLNPGHNVYLHKALAHRNLGELEQAIIDLGKAIEIDKDYAFAYLNRGMIFLELGEIEKAKQDCEETIKLKPNKTLMNQARALLNQIIRKEK